MNEKVCLFWKPVFLSILAVFVLNSCQKEQLSSSELRVQQSPKTVVDLMQQGKMISVIDLPEPKFNLSKLPRQVASSRSANKVKVPQSLIDIVREQRELLERAINPDDFECGPTFLDPHFESILEDFTEEDFFLLNNFGTLIPILEGIFIDDIRDKDFFGYEGRFTDGIRNTFVDLRGFWDIPNDIMLSDMHGSVFKDESLVAELIQFWFVNFDEDGTEIPIFSDELALTIAQDLKEVFGSDKFDNYNHPLLTFNAIAFSGAPEIGVPKKILMGDGIMEVYAELGLGSMAERFILAHEYGHHIHFSQTIFGDNTPESTRFLELLADTYASYYASHGKGLFLHPLVLNRYLKTSFSVGDCGFDSPGHHGTPNQRARAAALGGELAKRVGIFDPKLSSDEILEIYIANFSEIIKPDAG